MFVSFEVANYGPFSETICITTQADLTKKEHLEENTFSDGDKRYNHVSFLYGFNGSGKSHLFRALLSMQQILTLSPIIATKNQQILDNSHINYEVSGQRNFFKFNEAGANKPTCYAIEIKIDGVLYSYGFEVLNQKIVKEYLFKKNKRKELLLERTSERYEDIVVRSELKSFENFLSTVKENVLCLSMAMFLNNELAVRIYQEINNIEVINMASLSHAEGIDELEEEDLKIITQIIQLADNTIKDLNVELEKEEVNEQIHLSNDFESRNFVIQNFKIKVESVHNIYRGSEVIDEITLPFLKFESNGTVKLFGILPAIIKALKTGGVLFVDEIENGLHPNLTRVLIRLFNSSQTNPLHAQLICSSHETLLLKENIRRDQVWFLYKNKCGESTIRRLSTFPGTRMKDDIAKKYLDGAFGEVPKL